MFIGKPFILLDLESGDCERFNNTYELRKKMGLNYKNGARLEDVLKHPKISERYKFFAYESDLLKYEI